MSLVKFGSGYLEFQARLELTEGGTDDGERSLRVEAKSGTPHLAVVCMCARVCVRACTHSHSLLCRDGLQAAEVLDLLRVLQRAGHVVDHEAGGLRTKAAPRVSACFEFPLRRAKVTRD